MYKSINAYVCIYYEGSGGNVILMWKRNVKILLSGSIIESAEMGVDMSQFSFRVIIIIQKRKKRFPMNLS